MKKRRVDPKRRVGFEAQRGVQPQAQCEQRSSEAVETKSVARLPKARKTIARGHSGKGSAAAKRRAAAAMLKPDEPETIVVTESVMTTISLQSTGENRVRMCIAGPVQPGARVRLKLLCGHVISLSVPMDDRCTHINFRLPQRTCCAMRTAPRDVDEVRSDNARPQHAAGQQKEFHALSHSKAGQKPPNTPKKRVDSTSGKSASKKNVASTRQLAKHPCPDSDRQRGSLKRHKQRVPEGCKTATPPSWTPISAKCGTPACQMAAWHMGPCTMAAMPSKRRPTTVVRRLQVQ